MTENHTCQPSTAERKQQIAALKAAAELASMTGLPAIWGWQIHGQEARAQLAFDGTDGHLLAELHAWAAFFSGSTSIQVEQYKHLPDRTKVWVEATWQGVHVEIWSAIDTPESRDKQDGGTR